MLEVIRSDGPISRAQIARTSGLSKPTVSQALTSLETARLVRTAGRSSGGKGPTAVLYELDPHAGWVVGIDVGRERVRAAVADLTGTVVARRTERTRRRSSASLIEQISVLGHDTVAEAGVRWRAVQAVVVGSPGVFSASEDHPVLAHNLPGWTRPGLLDEVRRALGAEVLFENDVDLAAIGESAHGRGAGLSDFVYLHVGTGVGMGIVIDGELHRGAHGAAGEVGYLPLEGPGGAGAARRRRGALEASIGSAGVVADARARGMRGVTTAAAVLEAARDGDARGMAILADLGRRIAWCISSVVSVLDPELVIMGGGVGRHLDVLRDPIERAMRDLGPFTPAIEASGLGEEAELIGAVTYALTAARQRLFDRGEGMPVVAV